VAVSFQPMRQKLHVDLGELMFARGPWNFFDGDAAGFAVDPPHPVQQKHQKPPEWNKLETSLGLMIVTGRWLMATRTDGRRTFARPHGHLDDQRVPGIEPGFSVNESPEAVATV